MESWWQRYKLLLIFVFFVPIAQLLLTSYMKYGGIWSHRDCPLPSHDGLASLILRNTKWPVVQHKSDKPQVSKRKDGECRCKSAWIGSSCDFDFFNSTMYLPRVVEKQLGWENDTMKLWKEFSALQMAGWSQDEIDELYSKPTLQTLVDLQNNVQPQPFDERFELDKDAIFANSLDFCQACEEWDVIATGIASDLRNLASSLVSSWANGLPLIPPARNPWLWAKKVKRSNCDTQSFDCFFEGVAPKCPSGCSRGRRETLEFQPWERKPDQRNSVIWLQSQAIAFLVRRPKLFIQDFLLEQMKLLNFPQYSSSEEKTVKIVGMHVRMGDACFDTFSPRKCLPFEEYVDAMREFHKVYDVTHVYIATDSQDVIDSLVNYPEFQWHYLKGIDRRKYNSKVLIEDRAHSDELDQTKEVQWTITETFLLSQCDGFIGTFSSNFGRMAFELIMARRQAWPPYITLDIPWCYHWVVIDEDRWAERDVTSSCGWF